MTELIWSILGSLIMDPSLLESEDLSTADFPAGREREVFRAITEIWESDRLPEVPLALLVNRVGGEGTAAFISGLIDGNLKPNSAAFSALVRELRLKNSSSKIVQLSGALAEEHLKTGTWDENMFRRLRALWEQYDAGRCGIDVIGQLIYGADLQALKVEVGWAVEKLAPSRSITILHGPGGLGKTWFSLAMANAVSRGEPFLGLRTNQRSVCYLDFENSISLLIERAKKLDIREVRFWPLSARIPPPKLDTAAYKLYQQLPAGSLLVIDTLRAAHDGDENSSKDMALVMNRLKELRELGFDIFLIHHTSKANERLYKGSTAISDMADHVLKLYRARKGSLEEIQDDAEPNLDATFVLATGKTRFKPFHMFLSFNPDAGGFLLAEDPKLATFDALAYYIAGPGRGQNQTQIIEWAKDNLGGGRKQGIIALLNRGEHEGRWCSRRGIKGAKHYEPKS